MPKAPKTMLKQMGIGVTTGFVIDQAKRHWSHRFCDHEEVPRENRHYVKMVVGLLAGHYRVRWLLGGLAAWLLIGYRR